jgi:hypothetical protein
MYGRSHVVMRSSTKSTSLIWMMGSFDSIVTVTALVMRTRGPLLGHIAQRIVEEQNISHERPLAQQTKQLVHCQYRYLSVFGLHYCKTPVRRITYGNHLKYSTVRIITKKEVLCWATKPVLLFDLIRWLNHAVNQNQQRTSLSPYSCLFNFVILYLSRVVSVDVCRG